VTIEIRLLEQADDRKSFRSSDSDLDGFLHKYAWQNQFRHHIGNTYVAADRQKILGFMTISVGSIELERLPPDVRKKLPRYPVPVLRVARLAVAEDAQQPGVGKRLMRAAFTMAVEVREKFGCIGIVVDAKPDAKGFYSSLGFDALEVVEGEMGEKPTPTPMFLPIKEVETAIRVAASS
jgi:ribosomal protein S18 acetylase RimI-like enzyme